MTARAGRLMSLTAERAMAERNAETRRALIEIVGWGRNH